MTANAETAAAGPQVRTGATIGTMVPGLRVADLTGLAQAAEEDGYDAIFTPEAWGTESFALVTAFAMATRSIAVGTSILPIANRSAALTGMGAATVDDASGGRLILGLGMGHRSITEGWHRSAGYEPRLSWLRDYVATVRATLAGDATPAGYRLGFPALRVPPIYLAALRPGSMRLAGEVADGALLYLLPLSRVAGAAAAVRAGAERGGRSPAEVDVCLSLSTCVTDDPAPVRAAAAELLAWYGNLPFYNEMFVEAGFTEEARALAEAWRAVAERDPDLHGWIGGGHEGTAEHVSDAMVDAVFAIGSAEECRARIAAVRRAGIDRVIVYPFGPYSGGTATAAGYRLTLSDCAGA